MSDMDVIEGATEVVAPPPARVTVALCPSQRSVKSDCRRCVAACPLDAIAFGDQRFTIGEQCTGCGICYASCPTGAVQMTRDDDRTLALALRAAVADDPARVARITCEKDAAPPRGALVLACLGRLTENLVLSALAAGASRVEVRAPACDGCAMSRGMDGFPITFELARVLCGLAGRRDALALVERFEGAVPGAPATAPEPEYSRRDFFRALKHRAAAGIATALPEPPSTEGRPASAPSPRRARLLELLGHLPVVVGPPLAAEGLPFAAAHVSGNCVGCNVCETVCPTGAIARDEDESTFTLRFAPARCVNCGVCAKSCYTRAIRLESLLDVQAVLSGTEVELTRFTKRRCEICGQSSVRRGDVLCFACQKRQRLFRRVFEQSGDG